MPTPTTAPRLAGNVLGSGHSSFVIAEWTDPGGPMDGPPRLIAPPHVHHHDDEAWYVLEGTLQVRVGEDEVIAHAGSAVLVSAGKPHTYWNPGPDPARYLLVMTARVHELIQAIHQTGDRSRAAMQVLFARFDSTLL